MGLIEIAHFKGETCCLQAYDALVELEDIRKGYW